MKENLDNRYKKIEEKFNLKEVILLILVTAAASLLTGFVITNRMLKEKSTKEVIANSAALDSFITNYKYIIENYYGEINEEEILDAALAGVLESLGDPYTAYIDKTQSNNFNAQLEGSYQGLGVEIYNDTEGLRILAVFSDSPADKAGLKQGDIIIKLNDADVTGTSSYDFANLIKNSDQEDYMITVLRNGEEKEINLRRETVILKSAASKIVSSNNKNIGYLQISIFANNTYLQVKQELENLESKGIDSLIIDVRGNTGGHLTSVENILSLFLNSDHIIYKIEQNGEVDSVYSTGKETKTYPIVILTNEGSASASEILTAALKEEYGAKSVGKKTYGKGSAQELVTMPNGAQYKFTTKKWLSPNGASIDNTGVDVDVEVDLGDAYKSNPIEENDTQLQTAIDLIANS